MVLNWLMNKETRSWTLQPIFTDIDRRIIRLNNVFFLEVEQNGNDMAIALAIRGVKHLDMFKA